MAPDPLEAGAWCSLRRIGVLGAEGLVGGGFCRMLPGALRLGRGPTCERRVDLDQPLDPGLFAGLDLLVHAAGLRDEDVSTDPGQANRRATHGTRALYQAAFAAGVRHVVHVSTAHVYGALEGTIDETTSLSPRSAYALLQRAGEQTLEALARSSGVAALIVRPNAVFGMTFDPARFRRWWLVPFAFPKAALEGEIRVRNPAARRNFVAAERVAAQALDMLAALGPGQVECLNTVGGDELSMAQFASLCADEAGSLAGRSVRILCAKAPTSFPLCYRSRFAAPGPTGELAGFVREFLHSCLCDQAGTRAIVAPCGGPAR